MEPLQLRRSGLEWREVEGEIVVLDVDRSVYVSVNKTGTVLWHSLAGGTDRESLVSELAAAYAIDRSCAEMDVDKFLAYLREQNLLAA